MSEARATTQALRDLYIRRESLTGLVLDASFLRSEYPELTHQAATAIAEARLDTLTDWGVHPISLLQLSRLLGFDLGARWEELSNS